MKPIEKYIEAMENKDFAGLADLFTKMESSATTAPTLPIRENIISMAKKPLTCSSVTNSDFGNIL